MILCLQLHIACTNGFIRVASLLMKNGAPMDVRDNLGLTPLHLAAKYGQVRLHSNIQLLF